MKFCRVHRDSHSAASKKSHSLPFLVHPAFQSQVTVTISQGTLLKLQLCWNETPRLNLVQGSAQREVGLQSNKVNVLPCVDPSIFARLHVCCNKRYGQFVKSGSHLAAPIPPLFHPGFRKQWLTGPIPRKSSATPVNPTKLVRYAAHSYRRRLSEIDLLPLWSVYMGAIHDLRL